MDGHPIGTSAAEELLSGVVLGLITKRFPFNRSGSGNFKRVCTASTEVNSTIAYFAFSCEAKKKVNRKAITTAKLKQTKRKEKQANTSIYICC